MKLRLPMKKFDNANYGSPDSFQLRSIIDDVVKGVKSGLNRFTEPFMYDETKIPSKAAQDLTATFSRDKEYL